jgi:hypothetical protein
MRPKIEDMQVLVSELRHRLDRDAVDCRLDIETAVGASVDVGEYLRRWSPGRGTGPL